MPERERCEECGGELQVRKTRLLTLITLDIGKAKARETILHCPRCNRNYGCEELQRLKPPKGSFGYDVLVYVGNAMFHRCQDAKEIQNELRGRQVRISESEIFYLAKKFIVYLSVAHRESQREIKQLLDRNGGYILHLDATCEGDSPHLMCGLDGISEIVLENTKLASEKAQTIVAFLRTIKALYGTPVAAVHDMGKGICSAVSQVFANVPDFICHYHFLADTGKDLLGADNDKIRNRLSKHGIQGTLRKRVRKWAASAQENPTLVQALRDGLKEGLLPKCPSALLPTLNAYTLVLWALDAKTQGDGYGFPFDRPYLIFYERLKLLHSKVKQLNEVRLTDSRKDNRPYCTILKDLIDIMDDATLRTVATQMREKVAVFDKLRDAMRLALPSGKNGLNDRGSIESMSTIEKRVSAFHDWLRNDQVLWGKECYRNLIAQMEKYWDKLFCDPIVVKTPKGTITIQPQRTNNLMEQFFRFLKRVFRKKSGTRPLGRTMKAMIADTPLVRNLENPGYMKIILNGKSSLEERFSEIDIKIVRKELRNILATPDKVPAKIKELLRLPGLPDTLVALFTGET